MAKLKKTPPGTVFGQLTVLGCCRANYKNHALCICTCGAIKKVLLSTLGRSANHNCGCASRGDLTHRLVPSQRQEATALARTYRAWANMWEKLRAAKRLSDVPMPPDRWKDFENFKQDMGYCPISQVLDRIDVRLPYYPGNCRWVPQRDAYMHRESTIYYYNGKVIVHEQHLSKLFGYSPNTLKARRLSGEPCPGWKILSYDEVVAVRRINPSITSEPAETI